MRVLLIHNPKAGDGEHFTEELLGHIREAGHDVSYVSVRQASWEDNLEKDWDLVAIAGGDGTVGKVSRRLIGTGKLIAVLPLGTANNIASALNIFGMTLPELIDGWSTGERLPFDIITVEGPWGLSPVVESFGMGLLPEFIEFIHKDKPLAGIENPEEKVEAVRQILIDRLQHVPPRSIKVELDGMDLSGDYVMVQAMNIPSVGSRLCLAPDAELGDGEMDVVLLKEFETHKLSAHLAGRCEYPELVVHRGKHLSLEWEGSHVMLDDQVWPEVPAAFPAPWRVDLLIRPQQLQFLVPGPLD